MKYLSLLFVLCAVFPSTVNGELLLTTTTNKRVYLEGEPVIVSVVVENRGKAPVEGRFFCVELTMVWAIHDETGREVRLDRRQGGVIAPALTSYILTLKPKERASTAFDTVSGTAWAYGLATGESIVQEDGAFVARKLLMSDGRFRVRVACEIPNKEPIEWLRAFTPEFQVQPATGDDAEALKLFRWRAVAGKQEYNLRVAEKFRKLYRDFPKSPYSPFAKHFEGTILEAEGKPGEALLRFQELTADGINFPLRADALYHLAKCQLELGNSDKTREILTMREKEFGHYLVEPLVFLPFEEKGQPEGATAESLLRKKLKGK